MEATCIRTGDTTVNERVAEMWLSFFCAQNGHKWLRNGLCFLQCFNQDDNS